MIPTVKPWSYFSGVTPGFTPRRIPFRFPPLSN